MKCVIGDNPQVIHIKLSRANLVTLLTKLDEPESKRTIRRWDDNTLCIVTAETDESHYADRNGMRGIMNASAEAAIASTRGTGVASGA